MQAWKSTKRPKCRWIVLNLPNTKPKAFLLDDHGNLKHTNGIIQPDPTFDFDKIKTPEPSFFDFDFEFDCMSPPPSPLNEEQQKKEYRDN